MTTISWGRRAKTEAVAIRVLALVGIGCGGGAPQAAPPPSVVGASSVPLARPADFVFDSIDERPVSSEATRGKPTVIAFITTSSLPAQAQVDFLIAMARHDGDRVRYAVVALEAAESRELVELYRKALSIPFPVALADAETRLGGGPFGDVRSVPVTVMLDPEGRVVWRVEGRVVKSEELRSAMRGL